MAQITLYLDDETAARLRDMAKSAGVSLSQWVSDLIRQRIDAQWPDSVRELIGTWDDFPLAEEIRKSEGADAERERF